MLRLLNNQRGITLFETIATILIFSLITLLIFNLLKGGVEFSNSEIEHSKQRTNYQHALVFIPEDIKNAKEITVENTPAKDILEIIKWNGEKTTYIFDYNEQFYVNDEFWFHAKATDSPAIFLNNELNLIEFRLSVPTHRKRELPFQLMVGIKNND